MIGRDGCGNVHVWIRIALLPLWPLSSLSSFSYVISTLSMNIMNVTVDPDH